jgi:hypothetical protein
MLNTFFIAGILFVLGIALWRTGVWKERREKVAKSAGSLSEGHQYQEEVMIENTDANLPKAPSSWNEAFIGESLERLKQHPNALEYYVQSIISRFITGQDAKTVGRRTHFLRSRVEMVRTAHEFGTEISNLKFLEVEQELRGMELEEKKRKLQRTAREEEELAEMELELKKLKIKVEMAKLQKEKDDMASPKEAPPKPPTRQQMKDRIQSKIDRLKRDCDEEIAKIMRGRKWEAVTEEEQGEVKTITNSYSDAIHKAREELAKYL